MLELSLRYTLIAPTWMVWSESQLLLLRRRRRPFSFRIIPKWRKVLFQVRQLTFQFVFLYNMHFQELPTMSQQHLRYQTPCSFAFSPPHLQLYSRKHAFYLMTLEEIHSPSWVPKQNYPYLYYFVEFRIPQHQQTFLHTEVIPRSLEINWCYYINVCRTLASACMNKLLIHYRNDRHTVTQVSM